MKMFRKHSNWCIFVHLTESLNMVLNFLFVSENGVLSLQSEINFVIGRFNK